MSASCYSDPKTFNSDDDNSPPYSPTATATAKPGFSLITQTIGRQLHNVASFLAPPPQQPYSSSSSSSSSLTPPLNSHDSSESSSTSSYRGIKNDLAEIGGSFKTGLSLLSSNKAVTEISKFASNLFHFDKRDDYGDDLVEFEAVGITDQVIDFVRDISLRPECWIDFPLSLQHKDFYISNVQKDHASAIEGLVPSLATLRHTIHNYMNEQQFWMIYFILLLPRLNEDDYTLLSTPQIVQVREVLLQKLKNKKNIPTGEPENISLSEKGSNVNVTERIENPFQATESSSKTAYATNTMKTENQENDVSFSDVDDEDNDHSGRLSGIKQTHSSNFSSASETSDWVRLNEASGTQSGERKVRRSTYRERDSESGESSDWLAVEDGDL